MKPNDEPGDDDLFAWRQQPRRETRADQILSAFLAFHAENPDVWTLFERFALGAIEAGRDHYSAKAVVERIRWHVEIETRGDEMKINNNFTAHFARMFHLAHPNHDGFFRNRKLLSTSTSDDAAILERIRETIHPQPK